MAHGTHAASAAFLDMEWLAGCDLSQRLRQGPLSVSDTLSLGQKTAQELAKAHARGTLHRDIRPRNLFLVDGDPQRVRILGFGFGFGFGFERRIDDAATLPLTGTVVGTPGYMAPEQVAGGRTLTAQVDVFGLGCVLFECLTGAPVFVGHDAQAVLANILSNPMPRLCHWMPEAAPNLDALLARMMARDPLQRFPDATAVSSAIAELQPTHFDS